MVFRVWKRNRNKSSSWLGRWAATVRGRCKSRRPKTWWIFTYWITRFIGRSWLKDWYNVVWITAWDYLCLSHSRYDMFSRKRFFYKLDSGPSTRAQKEIGRVRLSDSVVSLINNQSKCIIACLANGTIALIKSKNSLWDFSTSAIKIIDFGAPHHAIGCSILVEKNSQLWCGYRFVPK